MALGPLGLALGCIFVACSRPRAPAPRDEPLPWVDPARCLAPCSGPDPARLVSIDERGRLADPGRFRVDRSVQPPLAALILEAERQGFGLMVNGAHRTHAEQAAFFLQETEIGRYARPGHSEHELGLAVDLDYPDDRSLAFLQARGPTFGFVTSYPPGKERRTGFRSEPWHQRFVGPALALDLSARGLTLQEHLEASPSLGRWGDCSDCASSASRAPCGAVDARGRCDGTVLRWCMGGSLAAVDCSATGLACDAARGCVAR